MGWDSRAGATKQDMISEILSQSDRIFLKHRVVGDVLWTVEKPNNPEHPTIIGCFILAECGNGYGYKAMCEGIHPYYYTCPLSFFKEVPVPPNERAQMWREKCVYLQETKKTLKKKLVAGARVKLIPGCTVNGVEINSVVVINTKPLLVRIGEDTGACFRLKRSFIDLIEAP